MARNNDRDRGKRAPKDDKRRIGKKKACVFCKDNTAFIDQALVNAVPPPPAQIQDGGFETPSVGSGASAYQYNPAASSWAFVGQAGVSGNGSGFTSGNPPAPQVESIQVNPPTAGGAAPAPAYTPEAPAGGQQ